MNCLVTGGAGFIGSHLTERLLERGHRVTVYDNLSTGREEFLKDARSSDRLKLVKADILDMESLKKNLAGVDMVFHLSANADVRFGTNHPDRDLQQNTIGTFNVLEAMRANGVKKIAFSSTGSVYGEAKVIPTPEDSPFPIQTSLYGASKVAGEALISAYCEGYGYQGFIFRFVSILGERYTHGHIIDFFAKLSKNPAELMILGNGKQKKSYLYVKDCIDAIETATEKSSERVGIFNLGTDEFIEVNDSVKLITEHLQLKPELKYSGGERGWIGDNPLIYLDCKKMRSLGWAPKSSIREGISKTLAYLQSHPHLLQEANS